MKGLICVILGLLAMVFLQPAPLAAQNVKVGVVDLQKFQKNSKAFQRASLVVKKKFDDMQQKLNDERNAVGKLEEELKKQSMMLSLDAQEDKKREFEKKQRQFKFMYDEYSQEMKETEMEAIKKVMKDLEKVVEDYNKAKRMHELVFLRSPQKAIVLKIAERSVGSIIQPAEPFVTLVPSNSDIEVEVDVQAKDIGRIRVDDPVRVKLSIRCASYHSGVRDGRTHHGKNTAAQFVSLALAARYILLNSLWG